MQKTPYVFPIIGGRKVEHLMANVEALKISLSDEQIAYLESIIPFEPGFPTWMVVSVLTCIITIILLTIFYRETALSNHRFSQIRPMQIMWLDQRRSDQLSNDLKIENISMHQASDKRHGVEVVSSTTSCTQGPAVYHIEIRCYYRCAFETDNESILKRSRPLSFSSSSYAYQGR